MNGFEKIGHFPLIHLVWTLYLPMGAQAQLGHHFKLSSSLEKTRFYFVMRSSAHPTTPEAEGESKCSEHPVTRLV